MTERFLRRTMIALVLGGLIFFSSVGYAEENIDPYDDGSQYAYGENIGWLNFESGGGGGDGAEVTDLVVFGYVWAENIGWINLFPSFGGVTNDGNGNLSGHAWGENVGWINFAPIGGGVTIDANGNIDGWAWGENIGWIHFQNLAIPYKVQTSWSPALADITPPVLTIPSDITEEATGSGGAVVTYSVSATDDTDPAPSVNCSPASGSTFAIGTTTVNCTATDASGNSSSDLFTVTVVGLPDLVPTALMASVSNNSIFVDFSVANQGNVDVTVTTPLRFYASADDIFDVSDTMLCTFSLPAIAAGGTYPDIGTHSIICSFVDAVPTGDYHIIAVTDFNDTVSEVDESNNDLRFGPLLIGPSEVLDVLLPGGGTVDIAVPTDQVILNVTISDATGTPPAGIDFSLGMISYQVTSPSGGCVPTTFTFSSPLPGGLELYKVDDAGSYTPIPVGPGDNTWTQIDPQTVEVNLCDGGPFDLNPDPGIIRDPIALGVVKLFLFEIQKAEVEWEKQKIKVHGKVALPSGKNHFDVSPDGTVTMDLSTLSQVVNQSVIFDVKGSDGKKWEYKDDSDSGGVNKYKIDWKGAKFDYNQEVHIKSNHMGQDSTTLEVNSKGITGPLTITVGGVTINIDELGAVSVTPETLEVDIDDDGEIEVELPFALTPDMVIFISGTVSDSVTVGDYYTATVGKFEIKTHFDTSGFDGNLRPATLDVEITLGDVGYPGSFQIFESDWKELKTNEWKYKR